MLQKYNLFENGDKHETSVASATTGCITNYWNSVISEALVSNNFNFKIVWVSFRLCDLHVFLVPLYKRNMFFSFTFSVFVFYNGVFGHENCSLKTIFECVKYIFYIRNEIKSFVLNSNNFLLWQVWLNVMEFKIT